MPRKLLIIFGLALALRVYHLGQLPAGFHVDEAKVAWNAYSLFKTGRDDWRHVLPLHYDTFGDFRPTGIFYADVPTVALLGPSELATRLPGAVFGAVAVIAIYYLGGKWAAFLLAINPWHIILSRATSEGAIALTLILIGLVLLTKKKYFPALLTLLASLFFYHSALVLTPMMSGVFLIKNPGKKGVLVTLVLMVLAGLLFINPSGRGRLSQVSIFNDISLHEESMRLPFEEGPNKVLVARTLFNKPVLWTNLFITQYAQYFNPGFYITPLLPKPVRYSTVGMGLVSYATFGLLVIGLLKGKVPGWMIVMLLLAPIPAAMTTEDVPNLSRSVLIIPWVILIAARGAAYLPKKILAVILIGETLFFWHMYSVHNPMRYAIQTSRNLGVKELIVGVSQAQTKFDQVILTNIPDSLYPWYAVYTKQDPIKFNRIASQRADNNWQFGKIVFSTLKCPSNYILDQHLKNTAAADAEGCDDQSTKLTLVDKIERPGNTGVPYTIWSSK